MGFIDGLLDETVILGTVAVGIVSLIPLLRNCKRTEGTNIVNHIIFACVYFSSIIFLPHYLQNALFNDVGVILVGSLIPLYETIRAACSIEGGDNERVWLQYWIASGTFLHSTEWLDEIAHHYPLFAERWHEFEFFALLWLMLPMTDGSGLLYKLVTEPYLVPIAESLKQKADGKMALILVLINTGFIWYVWLIFLTLDEEARRFIAVGCGTAYPIIASIAAVSSGSSGSGNDPEELSDPEVVFWLAYWSCFTILFIIMDYLEIFVGEIKGFYSAILVATVYLFLPMFRGAEYVFRNVLVPLFGHYDALLLRDVHSVKMEMERKLPPDSRAAVMMKAAQLFNDNVKKDLK